MAFLSQPRAVNVAVGVPVTQHTGSPTAVTHRRLPQNVACGFPALRSSDDDSQHRVLLQSRIWQTELRTLEWILPLDGQESLPPHFALLTATTEHRAPVALDMAVDTQEAAHVARYTIVSVVASQALVDLLGLLLQRFMSNDLQQLMEFCQTASQTRLVGSPSHLEVPLAVARAVQGKA